MCFRSHEQETMSGNTPIWLNHHRQRTPRVHSACILRQRRGAAAAIVRKTNIPMLAESIDGSLNLLVGLPLLTVVVALVSFWPALRRHWSAPILAAPAVLFGAGMSLFLSTAQDKEHLIPGLWRCALLPLTVGAMSFLVWAYRLRRIERE
jgi:hypothetical protein